MSQPDPLDHSDELKRKVLAGDKIGAIKFYREQTGVGLAEAKSTIEQLETQLRGFESASVTLPQSASTSATPQSTAAIAEALFAGKKIAAIKLYRAKHQVGLAEAKHAVEEIEKQLRGSAPGLFAKPPASQSCLFAIGIALLLALALWKVFA